MKKTKAITLIGFLILFLSQINLIAQRDFDIILGTGWGLNVTDATANGTSNGVAWDVSPTNLYDVFGNTTGTYNGFNNGNFPTPVAGEDVMHIGAADFTITFSQPVENIVFYLTEDAGVGTQLDFGIIPVVLSGAANFMITGTAVKVIDPQGGAIRFENVNSTTMTHTATTNNSLNMAFYVESTTAPPAPLIPTMSQWALFILGLSLTSLAIVRIRKVVLT